MVPSIFIVQHESCFYEWALLFGHEQAAGDAGYSNIEQCIRDAVAVVPDTQCLVEVSYNGVHMGAYLQSELRDSWGQVAYQIVERHTDVMRGLEAADV